MNAAQKILCLALLAINGDAFAPVRVPAARLTPVFDESLSSSTALEATGSKRRETFQWLKRAALATLGLSTALGRNPSPVSAAEEEATLSGKVVELTVENLDGIPDNTGVVKIQLEPQWAPRGVERFEELTKIGFWDQCRFFRVLPGFVVQFGINGNPSLQAEWRGRNLRDDPVSVSNTRGTVVFATAGPNTRTTQIFINTREQGNAFLDKQGFSPIGKVIEGMEIVDRMYAGYGEGAPAGKGPNQGRIQLQGNSYLKENYPKLSFISKASFAD